MTARDLLALEFVAEAQPVTTEHVRRLLSLSLDMAWRRLRVLRDLGMLKVYVPEGAHRQNRYTLGSAAPEKLARVLDRDPGDFHVRKGIGDIHLEHHEAAVDLHVDLTLACAHSRVFTLSDFLHERAIRARLGGARGVKVPDAVARITSANGAVVALALEVDLGTENPGYVRDQKGYPYAELAMSGAPLLDEPSWAVCFTTPTKRRRNRLVKALYEVGAPEGLFYFAVHEDLDHRTILGDGWGTIRAEGDEARFSQESPVPPVRTTRQDGSDGYPARFSRFARDPGVPGSRSFAHSRVFGSSS